MTAGPANIFSAAIVSVAIACALGLPTATATAAERLTPRPPLAKMELRAPTAVRATTAPSGYRLIVKTTDGVRGRAVQGALRSETDASLVNLHAFAQREGLTFEPLIHLPEGKLTALQRRAEARTGTAAADLAGLMIVQAPGRSPAQLADLGNRLQKLPQVEFAELEALLVPPPEDIPPVTPDHTDLQGYLGPDPGMDVTYAAGQGFDGSGIRISDCEYGWNPGHEDLVDRDVFAEPGQTIHPDVAVLGWDRHGTAVIGETSAVANAYGVTGMSPGAGIYTYSEWTVEEGPRRVTAITHALADSAAGDVVLLEMQTSGASGFGPAELSMAVWVAVKTGVDAGVVVVGAAGNGNQNLDSPDYDDYRGRGHSGAILVGAGSNNTNHDKLSFSTYGSRVDLQGWGTGVFTLGYGGFATYGGDPNQRYTATFNGTSSASPFIASAAALVQQAAVAEYGERLSPLGVRNLLVATGISQGTGGHIGPFPDLQAAIGDLTSNAPPTAENDRLDVDNGPLDILFAALTGNDTDPEDDPLAVVRWTAPEHGTICNSNDKSLTYCPDPGYEGEDSFEYTVSDGVREDTGTVQLTVVSNVLFEDGFESGETSAWSAAVP
ncbi:MAG: S8 family serine peptidase [Acidobacteriota bacterium]